MTVERAATAQAAAPGLSGLSVTLLPSPLRFGATVSGRDVCYVDWVSSGGKALARELTAALYGNMAC